MNKIDCKKYKKSKTISSARNIEAKKNKNDLQREVTLTQIPIVYPDNKLEIPNPNRHLSKLLGFEQSF